jgi:predicted nucleic acid-binding protein
MDKGDLHHKVIKAIYEQDPDAWLLPWAILPEVDYLVSTRLGHKAQRMLMDDIAGGAFQVEFGEAVDLERAAALCTRHRDLTFGLVDAVVMATAERVRANAIVTLDLRHFGAVTLLGHPKLLPRDAKVKP